MEERKIHGMSVLDLTFVSQAELKALKKFKNLDKMTSEELEQEHIQIQEQLNRMTIEDAESFDGLVLQMRGRFVADKFEE